MPGPTPAYGQKMALRRPGRRRRARDEQWTYDNRRDLNFH
jgi:hypothetical protein